MSIVTEYIDKVSTERSGRAASQARYFLADLPDNLTPRALDAWRTSLFGGPLAPLSLNRKFAEVRSFLRWAADTERIEGDADKLVKVLKPARADTGKVNLPTQAQVGELLTLAVEYPGKRGVAACRMVCLCLYAGLRPGEAEKLTADDLPIAGRYMHIKRTKTGADRHAYYNQSTVLSTVLPILRNNVDGRLVPRATASWFSAAATQAGWSCARRNVLRKLCASYLACSGKFSEFALMQQFGHSTVVSVQHYRDPTIFEVIRAGTTIEQWMGTEQWDGKLIERCLEGI